MSNLLAVAVLFLGILFAPVVKTYADGGTTAKPTRTWMSQLDKKRLITQICIPGTHDSAAINSRCGDGSLYCHTQTYGFTEQLEKGIRFFDIRLAYEDGDLIFHHNFYNLGVNFRAAVDVVEDYLRATPSEFVIFLIKQEHTDESGDAFWHEVNNQMDDYPGLFHLDRSIPTVAEAAGKIIIMARDLSNQPQGYIVAWSDNTTHYEGHDGELRYVVEDFWQLQAGNEDEKYASILQNLYLATFCAHPCCNQQTLFITFVSATGAGASGRTPTHYADYLNKRVGDWLSHYHTDGARGIVAMDFGCDPRHNGDYLVQEVILQNFK